MGLRHAIVTVGVLVLSLANARIAAAAPPAVAGSTPAVTQPAANPAPALTERDLIGHKDSVRSVAFFPDGRRLVSGGMDKQVIIWNLENSDSRILEGHSGRVWGVAVSADGLLVASASSDKTVRVWDAKTGALLNILEGHAIDARGVAFLPGGLLLSGGGDGLRVWNYKDEKLVWKDDGASGGVYSMTITPDCKTVALVSRSDGSAHVWDWAKRKLIRAFEPVGLRHPKLAISPDSKELWGASGRRDLTMKHFDIASGKSLATLENALGLVIYSPDGKLLLVPGFRVLNVYDAGSLKEHARLRGAGDAMAASVAFSPDTRTVAVGAGMLTEDSNAADGDTGNIIMIRSVVAGATYDPNPRRPVRGSGEVRSGPKEGRVSWEVIPAKVQRGGGAATALDPADWPRSDVPNTHHASARKLADELDAIWSTQAVYLHRQKGILQELVSDPSAVFTDVVFDGKLIWVASAKSGLFVFDATGKLLGRCQMPELPASGWHMTLHPLGAGKILAAGSGGRIKGAANSGWLASLEWLAPGPVVKVLFREKQIPPEWALPNNSPEEASMRPVWFCGAPAGNGAPGYIYLACDRTYSQPAPMLRIDPQNLTVAPFNLQPKTEKGARVDAKTITFGLNPLHPMVPMDAHRVLHPATNLVELSTLSDQAMTSAARQTLLDYPGGLNRRSASQPILAFGGEFYRPGYRWYQIKSDLSAVDLGPGVRSGVGILDDEQTVYFVSGVLGLAAFDPQEKSLYRISVNPEHPAPIGATADVALGTPIPAEGVVETAGSTVQFVCGNAALVFDEGKFQYLSKPPERWLDPCFDTRAQMRTILFFVPKSLRPADAARAQLSQADGIRLRSVQAPRPSKLDIEKLTALYQTWAQSKGGAEKLAASKELMAIARAAGEQEEQQRRQYISAVKAAIASRQWKLLTYQPLDPTDK